MENIILRDIKKDCNKIIYEFESTKGISKYINDNQLFILFNEDVSDVPNSILTIPFVATFIGLAWFENCSIWVPEIDDTYYHSLNFVKIKFQELYYNFPLKGRIIPSKIIKNYITESNNSLLLFGGGIDAHCSFIRNKENITHVCNIQGWQKNLDDVDCVVESEFRMTRDFATKQSIIPCCIKSNFASIINTLNFDKKYRKKINDSWWHGIQHSMAFISHAIIIAFKNKIPNILIGSSVTVGDYNTCGSYVTTDSEFKFAFCGKIVHDGFELNRQDKVNVIVDFQNSLKRGYPIKVCSFNDNNCCRCEKCFRTILGIVGEGGNPCNFGFNFVGTLKSHWQNVMHEKIGLMGFKFEEKIYWPRIKKRMSENYSNLSTEQQEFVDWFLTFNFNKAKKKALFKYYKNNFFTIVKRKLHL